MLKRAVAAGLAVLGLPIVEGAVQPDGTTVLLLRVAPEARLDPQQVMLRFRVSADGASDVVTAAAVIVARVRTQPGRPIRVTVSLANLEGPAGPAPASAVRWTASALQTSGGARPAACTSGAFSGGTPQDLVEGWQQSGALTCAVNFELADARRLPVGLYSGVVQLAAQTH